MVTPFDLPSQRDESDHEGPSRTIEAVSNPWPHHRVVIQRRAWAHDDKDPYPTGGMGGHHSGKSIEMVSPKFAPDSRHSFFQGRAGPNEISWDSLSRISERPSSAPALPSLAS